MCFPWKIKFFKVFLQCLPMEWESLYKNSSLLAVSALDYLLRRICVCGRHFSTAQDGTEDFQGPGMLLLLCLSLQTKTNEVLGGLQQKPSQALNTKEVVYSNWKVADVTHAVSAVQVFIHTFKAVSFPFPGSLPSFLCPPLCLSPVCPQQILKVMVITAERVALSDCSKEEEALKNYRK